MMTQGKIGAFLFYCIFEFFGTKGVHHMKQEKTYLEVHFLKFDTKSFSINLDMLCISIDIAKC